MLNQGNICSPIMKCQRNGFDFCIMEFYLNKTKELFNSGEWKKFFRNISHFVVFGLTACGRKAWEEKETSKDTSMALIHQEQSFTSELFKVIQDAVSLIFLYRTMWLFRVTSPSASIKWDVQSVYIPSSIRGSYFEVENLRNMETVFILSLCGTQRQESQGSWYDRVE